MLVKFAQNLILVNVVVRTTVQVTTYCKLWHETPRGRTCSETPKSGMKPQEGEHAQDIRKSGMKPREGKHA